MGMTASTALFDSIEGQPKANWRPPPLETYSRETRYSFFLLYSYNSTNADAEALCC